MKRRLLLRAVPGTAALGVLGACGPQTYRGPTTSLRIAAGERGGLFYAFATLLAGQIAATEPKLRPTVVETDASQQNLRLLTTFSADLALTLLDSATGEPGRSWLRALGRTYEDYLQLLVSAGGRIQQLADLAGARISLGAAGSGAAFTGQRLLAVAGLENHALDVRHYPIAQAAVALRTGSVDALLWSGGIPTPLLSALARKFPVRMLDLQLVLADLQGKFPDLYDAAVAPPGVYGQQLAVRTVGVATLLTCRADLDPAIAAAVTNVLVTRSAQLVPPEVVGTQFLDTPTLLATGRIPLHPGAITAYRQLRH
ncbi:TAXI family TRAP transporter solute-binding subunit [Fodinicola feengrottensis]|uniref:TAXI family TRAP transporter solute-binding subunit n=1 Tax=Fodinicola feengrottensis TaxID=435914 RepID=A0ABP4RZ44_9ACTN|nr:TAXI family TRAP transporter solute-binding subunit [Fodinicola feengrottensis]